MSILYKPKKEIKWTLKKVAEGFEKFHDEYKRYPMSNEIDDFDYLPSARQIQRSFGGLVSLRKKLGLSIESYGTGIERSQIAKDINKRGRNFECIVYELLKNIFQESFVHVERPVDINLNMNSKDRFDFYVYAKPNNFAVDVFSTRDIRCFIKVMNMKEKKYRKSMAGGECLYFVYFSEFNLKDKIDNWLDRKKETMLDAWKIISFDDFKKEIKNYKSFGIIN